MSLTSHSPEVNTEDDLLSPAQLKTKRGCGRGRLMDVSGVTQVVAEVICRGGGGGGGSGFQVSQRSPRESNMSGFHGGEQFNV